MTKSLKKLSAIFLSLIMVLGTVAIGGSSIADLLGFKASADETTYAVGDIIEYGTYPQSKVEDEELITALNALAGDNADWTSYGYYIGAGNIYGSSMIASNYMRYKDVSYNGNKYRAVIFDCYRPCITTLTSEDGLQSENGYEANTVYWFKYEPVEWRILDPDTGLIMCNSIIDSQAFHNLDYYDSGYFYGDEVHTYYANNYAESTIREWLNNNFFDTAFTDTEKGNILSTAIDNSACSTEYSYYDSAATEDNIYLLSLTDVTNIGYGFSDEIESADETRVLDVTDYALSQGLCTDEDESAPIWYLRTAGVASGSVATVGDDGYIDFYTVSNYTGIGVVPAMNLSSFETDEEQTYAVGDIIEYGTYPQSKVEDEELIIALNSLAGDNADWTSYGYYSGSGNLYDGNMTASDYMRYTDILCNGSRYRGVIFDSYRPFVTGYTCSISDSNQNDNGYTAGNVYWFKYEPIKWRVLDPSTGLVMCATVIDSQAYNNYALMNDWDFYGDAGLTYYASNYAESSIREWLNDDFYNTAFSTSQKSGILETECENSSSYNSSYNAPSTTDRIYLLSYADSVRSSYGFSSEKDTEDSARRLLCSDYALCQGCEKDSGTGCCSWLLRTPEKDYSSDYITGEGCVSSCETFETNHGVVPVMNLQTIENSTDLAYFTGDIIEYGNYPRSKVTDEATIAVLNNLAGDNADWTSYGYYSGNGSAGSMTASDYMRYTDVLYNGSKYRGIVFDTYRPFWTEGVTSTSQSYLTHQGTNGYICGNVYWFKYEPIKWKVLDPDAGMVMCDSILDSQAFNNYFGADQSGDPDGGHDANDYEKSSLREWLNADFYSTAFSTSQKENIALTTLDNSAYSTSYSQYNSASTTDKIYILSWSDAQAESYGFTASTSSGDSARILEGTDYAKSQGLLVDSSSGCSHWRLRTAGNNSHSLCGVAFDGSMAYSYDSHNTPYGIVPVMNLSSIRCDTESDESTVSNGDGTHTVYDETGKAESTDDCTYITTVTKDATCTEKGIKVFTCRKCGYTYTEEIPVIEHTEASAVKENEIAPTCTEDGSYDSVVYCFVCNAELSKKTVTVPATGHSFTNYVSDNNATCTKNATETAKCDNCEVTDTREIADSVLDHTPGEAVKESEIAPTCTETGSYDSVVYCSVCNAELSSKTVTVPATGHSFTNYVSDNNATCTKNATETAKCDRCDATDTREIADSVLDHTPGEAVKENEIAPTCTETGSYDSVVYCSVCNAELSSKTVTVPATGHSFTNYVSDNNATCTENGTETAKCDNCDVTDTREIADTAAGHTPAKAVKENVVASTCAATGSYDSVVYCSVCKAEISREECVIPVINHNFEITYDWTDDCTGCTLIGTCANCGKIRTLDGVVSVESETPATCTEAGSITYAAVFEPTKEIYYTERKTVEIPATGHDYSIEYVWNEDSATGSLTCTATATCKNDSTHVVTETSSAMLISALGASCYSEGAKTYGAKFSNSLFDPQINTVTVPKTEHTPAEAVKENEIAPTCTETGSYDSVICCSVCNDEISRETITVDATGHSFTSYVNNNNATCTKNATETAKCDNCDVTDTREIADSTLAHIPAEAVNENEVAPGCTEDGSCDSVVYCSVCNDEISRETISVPATGHIDEDGDGKCDVCGTVTDEDLADPCRNALIEVPSGEIIGWKFRATMTAEGKGIPEGYHIAWYEGDTKVSDSARYTTGSLTEAHTYTAKIVAPDGNVASSDSQNKSVTVTVRKGIPNMIVSFFLRLFGHNTVTLGGPFTFTGC